MVVCTASSMSSSSINASLRSPRSLIQEQKALLTCKLRRSCCSTTFLFFSMGKQGVHASLRRQSKFAAMTVGGAYICFASEALWLCIRPVGLDSRLYNDLRPISRSASHLKAIILRCSRRLLSRNPAVPLQALAQTPVPNLLPSRLYPDFTKRRSLITSPCLPCLATQTSLTSKTQTMLPRLHAIHFSAAGSTQSRS